jgi:purine-cytosine permease-like protein
VYSFLGLAIPTVRSPLVRVRGTSNSIQTTLQCLGAAAAVSAPFVPSWRAGYADGDVGGLLDSMLFPLGKFGKVSMVLLSLSVTTNNTLTIYSMGMAVQTLIPSLVVVPRCVVSVIITVA